MTNYKILNALSVWILFSISCVAQNSTTPPKIRLKWFEEHQRMTKESPFQALRWRLVGPSICGGRMSAVAVPRGRPYTIYTGSANGGVWKSENNGTTWKSIWDEAPSNAVGAIAISESNPEIIWVGAGDNQDRRWSYSGTGVYKSLDGGKNWDHKGLSGTHHTGRIVIDPKNSDIVFVATMGHLYTSNKERGLYKTTDGGDSWKKVLYIDENTGIVDVVFDPSDSQILYAAAYQRIRQPWKIYSHGPGGGIYKSTDGGETWRKLSKGLPAEGFIGRTGLDVSPSNPNVVYALVDNHESRTDEASLKRAERYGDAWKWRRLIKNAEVYRSDDKGETWRKVNEIDLADFYYFNLNRGWYHGVIRVSPDNEDEIYILGVPLFRSVDGGKTYERIAYRDLHSDHHDLWIDPENSKHLISANDGGLNVSYDRGKTWVDLPLPVGQFYSVTVDMEEPFNIYGVMQDAFCMYGSVTSIPGVTDPWKKFPGGERSFIAFDTTDYQTLYTSARLTRTDRKTWATTTIEPPPAKEGEPRQRKTWFPPFLLSPHNPQIIYSGSQKLFRSMDRGENWTVMSPDLTTNPGPDRQDGIGYGTITMIAESPFKFGEIYVGTDDGLVQVSHDSGETWTKITDGLPSERWVSRLVASQYEAGTVYLTLNGLRNDDFTAYVFRTRDYGNTWTDIKNNLPCGPVNVIREDPLDRNILYLGTDLGVYVSLDQGESWHSLCSNLPTTFVHDLVVHPRDNVLVIGTHGRSVFVVDIGAVRDYARGTPDKDLHLFTLKPFYRVMINRVKQEVPLYYYLKESEAVLVEITNSSGTLVKAMEVHGDKGINAAIWDLSSRARNGRDTQASPGKYTITLKTKTAEISGILEVRALPRDY